MSLYKNESNMEDKKCYCEMAKPVFLLLIGIDFLLGTLGIFTNEFVQLTWPILLILIAITMMTKRICKCCKVQ